MSKKPPKQRREPEKEQAKKKVLGEREIVSRALREVTQLEYITPYTLATRMEIKIGAAKRLLRELEEQGKVRLISPNKRSPLYELVK